MATKTKQQKPPESITLGLWDADERFRFFGAMAALGVIEVKIEYAGSGDSGQIGSISASGDDDAYVAVDLTKEWIDKLDDFACKYLEHLSIDWYNNEGGQGTLTLNIAEQKASLDHEHNITSVEEEKHDLEL